MENSVGQKPNLHENIFTPMWTLLFTHLRLPHFPPSLLENRICDVTLVDLVILFLLYRHLFVSPLLFPPAFYRIAIQAETIGLEATALGPGGSPGLWCVKLAFSPLEHDCTSNVSEMIERARLCVNAIDMVAFR